VSARSLCRSHLDRHKPAAPVVRLDGLCAAVRLRRIGLHHTPFAKATWGTIRLKLPKIGALVRVSVRRIKVAMGVCRSRAAFREAKPGSWRLVPLGSGISLARLSFVRIGRCQGDDPRLTRPTVHAGTLNPGTNPYQSRWGCEPRRRGGAALMKFNGAQDRWLLSDRVGD
jgi:hypothetical protein